jgi:hypothetical protein
VSQSFVDTPYATSAETAEYTSAISVALLTTVGYLVQNGKLVLRKYYFVSSKVFARQFTNDL